MLFDLHTCLLCVKFDIIGTKLVELVRNLSFMSNWKWIFATLYFHFLVSSFCFCRTDKCSHFIAVTSAVMKQELFPMLKIICTYSSNMIVFFVQWQELWLQYHDGTFKTVLLFLCLLSLDNHSLMYACIWSWSHRKYNPCLPNCLWADFFPVSTPVLTKIVQKHHFSCEIFENST